MMVQMTINYTIGGKETKTVTGEWVIATGPFSSFWVVKNDEGIFSVSEHTVITILCDELPDAIMIPVEDALNHITMQKEMMVNQLTQQYSSELNPSRRDYS
jgi:hypothetical protein